MPGGGDCRADAEGAPPLLAGAGARRHDTERCCQGVKSTFFLAPSRLNGLRGREFEGEAGEPVFGLVRGLARGKGAFCARTTVTVCVSREDL